MPTARNTKPSSPTLKPAAQNQNAPLQALAKLAGIENLVILPPPSTLTFHLDASSLPTFKMTFFTKELLPFPPSLLSPLPITSGSAFVPPDPPRFAFDVNPPLFLPEDTYLTRTDLEFLPNNQIVTQLSFSCPQTAVSQDLLQILTRLASCVSPMK